MLRVGTGAAARRIAYLREPGRRADRAGVLWLCGFKSEMTSTKASALAAWARRRGIGCLRFDYSGHGRSEGAFEEGTIGRWREEAQAVFCRLSRGPQVLVGSSMGGWLSLLAARARPERLAGLMLIAAAPDFTERMLLKGLSAEDRATLQRDGRLERPSQYSPEPSVFTWKLIEEGRKHLVLDKKLALPCPVHLLHGQSDPDVPWEYSLQIAAHLEAPEVITTFVKGGDHRLSTPADIARLITTVEELVTKSNA